MIRKPIPTLTLEGEGIYRCNDFIDLPRHFHVKVVGFIGDPRKKGNMTTIINDIFARRQRQSPD